MDRANPFGSLDDFQPKTTSTPVPAAEIDQLAQESGFPSRQAPRKATAAAPVVKNQKPRRRYTTGRNQQINVKATAETVDRFYRLADEHEVPLGELLDLALTALEQTTRSPN